MSDDLRARHYWLIVDTTLRRGDPWTRELRDNLLSAMGLRAEPERPPAPTLEQIAESLERLACTLRDDLSH